MKTFLILWIIIACLMVGYDIRRNGFNRLTLFDLVIWLLLSFVATGVLCVGLLIWKGGLQ